MPHDPSILDRLRRLDACAVSDACDQLGLDRQVVAGPTNLTGRQRIAGRAITVLLGRPTPQPTSRHLCTAAIEAAGPDHVIVVAHQGRADCAGWGGNLSRAAHARGVAGTIVDGAIRDVDEATELGYPVYATSATPRTARGRAQEHAWNADVDLAGVTIRPDDLVIADSTGIVIIPADHTEAVLAAAAAVAAREALMAAAIDHDTPISTVMGADYEHMLHDPHDTPRADITEG